jgi:hypothetical protein
MSMTEDTTASPTQTGMAPVVSEKKDSLSTTDAAVDGTIPTEELQEGLPAELETATTTNTFQDQLRRWFLQLSPEERAASMGFADENGHMMDLLVRISPSLPTTTTKIIHNTSNQLQKTINGATPSFPPETTTKEEHNDSAHKIFWGDEGENDGSILTTEGR